MQHNIFTTMRSLKIMDGCKGSQVFAVHRPSSGGGSGGIGEKLLQQLHDHIK
ncbi:ethylene-overproduction protein 1-like, partial [Trifolium medium]|nr:ethylene-overproduction protein 1-like [Trifolium medium]